MVSLEVKRFINNKSAIYLFVSMCLIVLTNIAFEQAFGEVIYDNSQRLLNAYQSFSQFSFFILAPVIGGMISKDFKNKYMYFYYQNKISLTKYFITKFILTSFFITLFLTVILFVYQLIFPVQISTFLTVYIILLFNLLYCITVGLFLSLFFRKQNFGVMGMIFFFFIISIVNLIPIPYFRGFMSVVDTNSYSAAYIQSLLGLPPVSLNFTNNIELTKANFLLTLLVPFVWMILFLILTKLEIKCIERSGYYV